MKIRQRKTREDALKNREGILKAARTAIQEFGVGVAFEEIAKASGVGRATIYRNFPDRHALLIAIYELNLEELEQAAEKIGDRDDAFFLLLRTLYKMGIENRYLGYLIRSSDFPIKEKERLWKRFVKIFSAPTEVSKAAGLLRSDFQLKHILIVANMLGGAVDGIDPDDKRSFNWAYSLVVSYFKVF